jgi:hypothetical protein
MNKEFLRMQKLAGLITENQMNELTPKSDFTEEKHFVVIVFGGNSDELGNMKGVSASTKEEFTQKLKDIYGENLESVGLTFYETNKEEMNKIVSMSDTWEGEESDPETGGIDSITSKLKEVASKGKPLDQISF